jgi:hypothetical protein
MPNWCNNTLIVEGDLNALNDFKKKVLIVNENDNNTIHFSMQTLMPTPPELLEMSSPAYWRGDENDTEGKMEFEKQVKELIKKYGHSDWYDWRVSNWGTKWDCADSHVDEMNGEGLQVYYNTAWGPNTQFIKFAASVYPSLRFKLSFEEPGMGFCGVYEVTGDDEDYQEGDLEWKDEETDRLVTYDSEIEKYRYVDNDEVIDDEDFSPIEHNPFA